MELSPPSLPSAVVRLIEELQLYAAGVLEKGNAFEAGVLDAVADQVKQALWDWMKADHAWKLRQGPKPITTTFIHSLN
jgi:hypothetical protein